MTTICAANRQATGRPAAMREALDFYAKAVALDPSFAEAYAADARTAVNSLALQLRRCAAKRSGAQASL